MRFTDFFSEKSDSSGMESHNHLSFGDIFCSAIFWKKI